MEFMGEELDEARRRRAAEEGVRRRQVVQEEVRRVAEAEEKEDDPLENYEAIRVTNLVEAPQLDSEEEAG
jgi:hypothetical protein